LRRTPAPSIVGSGTIWRATVRGEVMESSARVSGAPF
jgi:hypothetical protein